MDFSDLNPTQIKVLKKIAKNPQVRTEKYGKDDLDYLKELGLIKSRCCDHPDDYYYEAYISEKGKAFLHGYKVHIIGERITRVIAILAFILSLVNTFTPFPELVQEFIKSMFTK